MLLGHWLAFTLASTVPVMIPGPTVLLVVSYALGHGRKSALATAVGVGLGDLTAMTASMIGLGALLAASASVFTALRLVGAAYPGETEAPDVRPRRMLAHAYAVTALNPKSIVFFIAFVPQFRDPARPLVPQAAILIVTFVVLAVTNAVAYALLAAAARRTIRRPAVQRAVNRTGGTLLIGAGVAAAAWGRSGG